jgi:PAS domain S-box-containing protein
MHSTGQGAFNLIHRFQHQAGEMRWSSLKGKIEYCPQGKPLRAIGVATDITEQRVIEQQAHQNNNRLQQVLQAGRLGFWDWNIQTGDVYFGGSWASMLGYSIDTISPNIESWSRLVHPEDKARIDKIRSKHLRGETEDYESEHRLKKSDGSWLWVLDRGRVVERDLDGCPLRATGIYSDISEIQRARESMKSEAKKKDIFLATLAHELRNPLAPIRTGLEILKLASNPGTVREVHETMSRQLLLLVRLIDDLLDISRITEGKLILQKQRCSLHDIVQLGIESSQPLIDHKKHTLTITQPSEPIYLHADTPRLAQVLCNLLKNAAKYTPESGSIDLTCNTSQKYVSIVLKDSGVGIEQKHQEAVFEMFHQIPESQTHAEGGLGIGLSLAKLITELHGGTITVFSQGLNQGTTVTLRIPRDGYENHTHH